MVCFGIFLQALSLGIIFGLYFGIDQPVKSIDLENHRNFGRERATMEAFLRAGEDWAYYRVDK